MERASDVPRHREPGRPGRSSQEQGVELREPEQRVREHQGVPELLRERAVGVFCGRGEGAAAGGELLRRVGDGGD